MARGNLTVKQAGSKGGRAVRDKYGPNFYKNIGRKGGQKVKDLIEKGKTS